MCFGLGEMTTVKQLLCTESCWDEFPDGSLGRRGELRTLVFPIAFDSLPNSSAILAL